MKIYIAVGLAVLLLASHALATDEVSFSRQIASILVDNCVACHGAKKAEGGYRIDTFEYLTKAGDSGAVPITANKPEDSELWRRVVTTDHAERMPADSEPLTAVQLELLKDWIAAGAPFDSQRPNDPLYLVSPPAEHPEPPLSYAVPVPIVSLAFSAAGDQILSGGYHELLCWNTSDGTLVRRIKNVGERIYAIAVSPDGNRLAVACGNPGRSGEVRLLDYTTGAVVTVCGRTSDVVLEAQYNPLGTRLAIGGADGLICILDAISGEVLHTLASHADWVNALAWSDDGLKLASASRDKSAKVYTADTGELLTSYAGHAAAVKGITFAPDALQVLTVGDDKKLHRWEVEGAKKILEVAVGGEAYKLLRGADFVIVPSNDKLLHRIDLNTNQDAIKYSGHGDWVLCAAMHVKNGHMVSGSIDGGIRLWNTADAALIRAWRGAP